MMFLCIEKPSARQNQILYIFKGNFLKEILPLGREGGSITLASQLKNGRNCLKGWNVRNSPNEDESVGLM